MFFIRINVLKKVGFIEEYLAGPASVEKKYVHLKFKS